MATCPSTWTPWSSWWKATASIWTSASARASSTGSATSSSKGNTKTNEHVIRREIRTKPGQLFNRSDVIRTQRELANLGYFDPEKLGVNPVQDPRTGTVDLEYTVEEKPSDRLELSGGWGAGRLVMSLGLSFTNFSLRKIFKPSAWQPLPAAMARP
jgi:outer membrane protein insertion porin family